MVAEGDVAIGEVGVMAEYECFSGLKPVFTLGFG